MESTIIIKKNNNGKATAGMVLGIIGLFASFIPLFGLPVNIVGLVMGILGLKSEKKGKAKAGVILSGIGMILTIGWAVYGVIAVSKMMK